MTFVEYIDRSSRIGRVEQLVSLFTDFIKPFGLEGFSLGVISCHKDKTLDKSLPLSVNFPEALKVLLDENPSYFRHPLLSRGIETERAFTWAFARQVYRPENNEEFMNTAIEAGVRNGVVIPCAVNHYGRFALALVSFGNDMKDDETSLRVLHSAGCHFIISFLEISSPKEGPLQKELTPRETEILKWVAAGKTKGEIGSILGISESTVKRHTEHIFQKLEVPNLTAAVARAIMLGILKYL